MTFKIFGRYFGRLGYLSKKYFFKMR